MMNHDAIEAAAASWLARRDSGHWTADDQQQLQAWLSRCTAHRVAWLRLEAAWQQAERMRALPLVAEGVAEEEMAGDESRVRSLPPAPARPNAWVGWAMAASVALVLGLIWQGVHPPARVEQFSTAVGGQQAVTLADGSRVTLNTHTRARAMITEQERKVWLDAGEAFFDVQHDPARPFVVAAGRDRVTVLGTQFSVRHEGSRTQVVVLEGRVRLDLAETPASAAPAPPTLITRHEAAVSQSGSVLVIAKTADQVQRELSWREGRLVFDDLTLGEIAAEFNRYNRKQMRVEGAAAALRLGGTFDAHNVEGFARLVHEGFGLHLQTDAEQIRLSSR